MHLLPSTEHWHSALIAPSPPAPRERAAAPAGSPAIPGLFSHQLAPPSPGGGVFSRVEGPMMPDHPSGDVLLLVGGVILFWVIVAAVFL